MRLKLFRKLVLTEVALLLLVLIAVDLTAAYTLRQDYLRNGFNQLLALASLASERMPSLDDAEELQAWVSWLSRSRVRVTIVSQTGIVLADSSRDPSVMENHADRPEIHQALSEGQGRAVRYSDTLNRELVYLAVIPDWSQENPFVLRFSMPLARIDEALAGIRYRLWASFALILIMAVIITLLISRTVAKRVGAIKDFSERVADGDFRPLPAVMEGDELDQLARSLNTTAARLDRTIQKLTHERNLSAAILSSMTEGVAVTDAENRALFCNQAFCRVFDLNLRECQGKSLVEITRYSDLLAVARQALAGQRTEGTEWTLGTTQQRSFLVTAAPVVTEGSRGAVIVLHDTSELKRLERVRRDFVANVSHELRTPLTAIQGCAETLLAGALSDPASNRNFVEIIKDHAIRLGALSRDLLKLSQIEAGKLELDHSVMTVSDLVGSCVETTRLKAGTRTLTLEVRETATMLKIRGDTLRLREVLQNLLDNAVQYTPPDGRIEVVAEGREDGVCISIADTGIGIPQADLNRVFERFYRVDTARSREAGGTGLGLSIAKHLVEAHGGRIEVESRIGAGSIFRVVLPATPLSSA